MCCNVNLNPHIVASQSIYSNGSPAGCMVWTERPHVVDKETQGIAAQLHMVGRDFVHLTPAFASSVFDIVVNVVEGLLDLGCEVGANHARITVPST